MSEPEPAYRDTPYGRLYRPQRSLVTMLAVVASFIGSILAGVVLADITGVRAAFTNVLMSVPLVIVFFAGYSAWTARLSAIAFDSIGRGILTALFNLIVRRKRPQRAEDVLPTAEKLEQMAVRAQQAAGAFRSLSWWIGLLWALFALLIADRAIGIRV
ncbi:MAG: hypothetical protein HC869_13905 [Rhodospirillales bacterium]|nr:hypothetical protein [Rhodospirillales bacterium]